MIDLEYNTVVYYQIRNHFHQADEFHDEIILTIISFYFNTMKNI